MSLTNTQYNAIMRQYEAWQIENQHIVEDRRQEVLDRCPRLKEIEDDIATLSLKQARRVLEGEESALAELHQQLDKLRAQKEELLLELNLPANYFEPPYHCPDCKDTGYISGQKCHCFKQATIDLVYTQSNLRMLLEEENFQTFSLDYYSQDVKDPATGRTSHQAAQDALEACRSFVDTFDSQFSNIFLYGDTGVGKTFLSHCVAGELLQKGHSVIYFTAFQLFQVFEQNTFHRDGADAGDYQNLFDCDLLIIDDLGTEFSNSFTTSQLFLCLNERILRQRSTFISTNLNMNRLAELYSERTFSRITSHYTILKLLGDDIRILKKLQGKS